MDSKEVVSLSENWGIRQRRTNRLVRFCAGYLLNQDDVTPEQIYGLCMLTWITSSHDPQTGAYIKSTKIPGLSHVFDNDFSKMALSEISDKISDISAFELTVVREMIEKGTGFSHFYQAYRNSSLGWMKKNFEVVYSLFMRVYRIRSDSGARKIIKEIQEIPSIPKGNNAIGNMAPEYLLTPLFFSLDNRLRFPIINGNENVQNLLKALNVKNTDLVSQFDAMVQLIGQSGIEDAADLDRLRGDLADYLEDKNGQSKRKKLTTKPTEGKALPLKDEHDIEIIKSSLSTKAKRVHNRMTNELKALLEKKGYDRPDEGNTNENMYDALVTKFDGKKDLLIEVKSSAEVPHVRMAVGQLLDYSRMFNKPENIVKAVLLPGEPIDRIKDYLKNVGIYLLWFENERLYSNSKGIPFAHKK